MNVSNSEALLLLNTSLQRLAAQRAACKLWSAVLTSLVLIMAAGRVGAEVLVWAAAPILLLALADAAYKAQGARIVSLSAKETIRVEDLLFMQSGNTGFGASVRSLSGLASFSVWPFYAALITMVIVMGQTVLQPQSKALVAPQNSSINGGPYLPSAPGSLAYANQQSPSAPPAGGGGHPGNSNFAQPGGVQAFAQAPPNQITVTRPNLPPMGVPASRPNTSGATPKAPTVPVDSAQMPSGLNRSAANAFPSPTPKTQPKPTVRQSSSPAKLVPSQTPPSK